MFFFYIISGSVMADVHRYFLFSLSPFYLHSVVVHSSWHRAVFVGGADTSKQCWNAQITQYWADFPLVFFQHEIKHCSVWELLSVLFLREAPGSLNKPLFFRQARSHSQIRRPYFQSLQPLILSFIIVGKSCSTIEQSKDQTETKLCFFKRCL